MGKLCMKAGCDDFAETTERGAPLMYCANHHPDLRKPGCGANPWRERLKCAGFCIAAHIVYELVSHFVLPLVV